MEETGGRLQGGWSFHAPAVSLGLIHTIKKSPLESEVILENALGRQPVVECEGILGLRGQDVLFPLLHSKEEADAGGDYDY